jgi:hypothetical protein
MKKILFFVSIILLLTIESKSQNFTFQRISSRIVISDTSTAVTHGVIKNISSSVISYKVSRILNDIPSGWESSMCCHGQCYGSETSLIPPTGGYSLGAGVSDTLDLDIYDTSSYTVGLGTIVIKVYEVSNPSVYLIDTFGVRLHTHVGISQISSIVKGYELKQNYPNPFNPSTSIEFSIPKNSDVNLEVYDMQGREVARLIENRKLTQGSYKFDFNINDYNLSSGVYFYKLITNDFISSKKMILLK